MEMILLTGKTNFFERVGEYKKSGVGVARVLKSSAWTLNFNI